MAKASDSLSLIGSLVPAGVIMPFGGATAPSGWLLCDGSAVSRTTYAALAAALYDTGTSKYAWGYGDNSTTFNLPDLRGRFIRGRDSGIARDPDRASRSVANTGGNDADNVGSVQVEATKKNGLTVSGGNTGSTTHNHGITDGGHVHSEQIRTNATGLGNSAIGAVTATGNLVTGSGDINSNTTGITINNESAHVHTFSPSLGAGDNETRPLNANVNYIIKI